MLMYDRKFIKSRKLELVCITELSSESCINRKLELVCVTELSEVLLEGKNLYDDIKLSLVY